MVAAGAAEGEAILAVASDTASRSCRKGDDGDEDAAGDGVDRERDVAWGFQAVVGAYWARDGDETDGR